MSVRRIALLTALFLIAATAYSDAVISDFKGKVEVRSPGGSWRSAETGMTVALQDTISTGFGASAVLSLGTNNVIVSSLTRMTLDAFLEREGTVDTKLFLQVGAVRAQVDDSKAKRQNFNISSPYSTASVRGTDFSFDGKNLEVFRGSVALLLATPAQRRRARGGPPTTGGGEEGDNGEGEGDGDGRGQSGVVVNEGQTVQIDVDFSSGNVTSTVAGPGSGFTTDPSSRGSGGGASGSGDDGGGSSPRGSIPAANKGSVTITWEWEE